MDRQEVLEKHKHRVTNCFWGLECGDGWLGVIDGALSALHPDTKVVQVKEKFGILRLYLRGGTEADYEVVRLAEMASARTCETCGKPGKLRGQGWYRTICDECAGEKQDGSGETPPMQE